MSLFKEILFILICFPLSWEIAYCSSCFWYLSLLLILLLLLLWINWNVQIDATGLQRFVKKEKKSGYWCYFYFPSDTQYFDFRLSLIDNTSPAKGRGKPAIAYQSPWTSNTLASDSILIRTLLFLIANRSSVYYFFFTLSISYSPAELPTFPLHHNSSIHCYLNPSNLGNLFHKTFCLVVRPWEWTAIEWTVSEVSGSGSLFVSYAF